MPKRAWFKFCYGDWRSNVKLMGATAVERDAWLSTMCLLADSDEYGVLRWDLKKIASSIPVHTSILESLVSQNILKGASAGESFEGFFYVDSRGVRHTLIPSCRGPVWYSSRMVVDAFREKVSSRTGLRGGNPTLKGLVNPTLNPTVNPRLDLDLNSSESSRGESLREGNRDRQIDYLHGIPQPQGVLAVPLMVTSWNSYLNYLEEKGQKLSLTGLRSLLTRLEKMGPLRAVAALEFSKSNNWLMVKEPEENGRSAGAALGGEVNRTDAKVAETKRRIANIYGAKNE